MLTTDDIRARAVALAEFEKDRLIILLLCDISDKLDFMISPSGDTEETPGN